MIKILLVRKDFGLRMTEQGYILGPLSELSALRGWICYGKSTIIFNDLFKCLN